MYLSDDEEDYRGPGKRLFFSNKKSVNQLFQADKDILKSLEDIQTRTQAILKKKTMAALGLGSTIRKLYGNKRQQTIDKNTQAIFETYVNADVLKFLATLFDCKEKAISTEDVEKKLKGMMLARFQVQALADDKNITDPPAKLAPGDAFELAVKDYMNLYGEYQANVNNNRLTINSLVSFLINHKWFMDVIVMHIAANHHRNDEEEQKAKESQVEKARMIKKGYFTTVLQQVERIVGQDDITADDEYYLFIFNRIVTMCSAFYEMVQGNTIKLDHFSDAKQILICQPIKQDGTDISSLLVSINDGKSIFSSHMNLFLNVMESYMIEYYVTDKDAAYNCEKVSLTQDDKGMWIVGAEPKAE